MSSRTDNLTAILNNVEGGDQDAMREVVPLIYDELQALAGAVFVGQSPGTMQPTALVHEAFLRLSDRVETRWNDRQHFFAVAAKVMRHVLADHARKRRSQKRGGDWQRVTISGLSDSSDTMMLDLEALDDAMRELEDLDPRQARIAELRFLAGLDTETTAETLGVSTSTVKREWRFARAWLRDRLTPSADA